MQGFLELRSGGLSMNTTILSFANLHNHGELFANLFRARKQSFIVEKRWNLPEALDMEYDQYDTPASRWIAIHDHTGQVYAGIRLTPRSEEHTSELQSREKLVCRLLLEKKKRT